MAEVITKAMCRALLARWPIVLLSEIHYEDTVLYLWSGTGELSFDDKTWLGLGIFGTVGPIRQTSDITIEDTTFRLSGVSEEAMVVLSAQVRNKPAKVWLACLTPDGKIVRDPYQIADMEIDYPTFDADDGNGSAAVGLVARSGFYTLERAIDEVWSSEDQRARYPDDTGMDLISTYANKEILWTRT